MSQTRERTPVTSSPTTSDPSIDRWSDPRLGVALADNGAYVDEPFVRSVPHPRSRTVKFTTRIKATGTNTTGIVVPPEVIEALDAGKRPAVHVTVNGHSYRSSIASMNGEAMISLSAENRSKAAVAAGEEVEVEVKLDTEPRTVSVPPDFAESLSASPAAQRRFEALSYSKKRWHVLNIEGAKTAETRQRRIAKSIAALETETEGKS
jgi:hypothetical protein